MPEPEANRSPVAKGRKRLKLMGITFAVVLTLFGLLYLATENESIAPFVYAIF